MSKAMISMAAFLAVATCSARADSLDDAVATSAAQLKSRGFLDDSAIRQAEPAAVYRAVQPYLDDENQLVRDMAVSWVTNAAARAKEPEVRREGIAILLAVAAGGNKTASLIALDKLANLTGAQDFDDKQRKAILELLGDPKVDAAWIKLAGIAGSGPIVARLHVLAESRREDIQKAAQLALARCGDRAMSEQVVKEVHSRTLLEKIRGISVLGYIRSDEAVAELRACLMSDEEIPSDGDMIGAKLSTFALQQLATVVQAFPVPAKFVFTEKDLKDAREWMGKHAEVKIIR